MALGKDITIMPHKTLRLVLFILLLIVCLSCSGESGPRRTPGKVVPETKAPDFTLKDLSGEPSKLDSFQGNPVLVIFSATWCPECRKEIPYFKEIYASYHSRGFQIVNATSWNRRDRVQKFAVKYELPYKTLLDESGRVAESYGVYGIPTALLIDKTAKSSATPAVPWTGSST